MQQDLTKIAILGFALTEAIALFWLMMAFLILFGVSVNNLELFKLIRQFKGIGLSVSKKLCLILGYDSRTKVRDLKKKDLERIDLLVRERVIVDKALNFLLKKNVTRSTRIKSYVGRRHSMGLPVRGQRTHSNGSTSKKLSFYKALSHPNIRIKNQWFTIKI